MSRLTVRLAFCAALALLGLGSVRLVHASIVALEDVANVALPASPAPRLLGPVNELGRDGWQCLPERAARAQRAGDAELPAPDAL